MHIEIVIPPQGQWIFVGIIPTFYVQNLKLAIIGITRDAPHTIDGARQSGRSRNAIHNVVVFSLIEVMHQETSRFMPLKKFIDGIDCIPIIAVKILVFCIGRRKLARTSITTRAVSG